MPPTAESSARPPDDFAQLLATKEPVLLVGGQAVNVWALYFHSRTNDLGPFVSFDVDVLGSRETLEALAQVAGTKPQFFPLRPPTNEIGVVRAQDAQGRPLLVEVLRYVNGITNAELQDPVYTVALGQTRVRIPGPIALLQAKIANVSDLDQTNRRDRHHVLILSRLMPGYLSDLQAEVLGGRWDERAFIDLAERLLRVLTTGPAEEVFASLGISGRQLFEGLGHPDLAKLEAFLSRRIPRSFPVRPTAGKPK